MADKFTASKSQLKADHRTNSVLASKFINCLMHDGKKSVAIGLFYGAMDIIVKKMPNEDPVRVFTEATVIPSASAAFVSSTVLPIALSSKASRAAMSAVLSPMRRKRSRNNSPCRRATPSPGRGNSNRSSRPTRGSNGPSR